MYLSLSIYVYIYIHIPGISCCTFGPQAANYECLYAALMVPILRSWAIYCFCLATGSLPPILGAPLCYPRPVTEQHPHCFRWQPRPRFTDYIELYNLFKYIIIIVYMSICFVCVYIYIHTYRLLICLVDGSNLRRFCTFCRSWPTIPTSLPRKCCSRSGHLLHRKSW